MSDGITESQFSTPFILLIGYAFIASYCSYENIKQKAETIINANGEPNIVIINQ